MPKTDKDVIYTEVYGAKVELPQFYDEDGNPVVISTNTPMPVTLGGVESIKGEQGPQGDPGPAGKDAEPQFTEEEVMAIRALISEE